MTSREFPHRSSSAELYFTNLYELTFIQTRKPWKNSQYISLRYETITSNPNESAEIMNEFQIGRIFSLL